MRKRLISLLVGVLIFLGAVAAVFANSIEADAAETSEIDWKTYISKEENVEWLFRHGAIEPQKLYTTTYVNVRERPNVESGDVYKVFSPNTKVNVVAEYNGWSKITSDDESYYIWSQYLSKDRVVVKKSTAPNNVSSSKSSGNYLGKFTLTAYCPCSKCCGKWAGGATASGTTPTAGRTVAMGGIPFGTKLLINGNVYTVEDRGTSYGHVDIFFNSHGEALNFGRRHADVYKVN